jgi:hypothetical protein
VNEEDSKRQLDMRALELAAGAERLMMILEKRMTRHEDDCLQERRDASAHRQSMREEIMSSIRALHARFNQALVALVFILLGAATFLLVKVMQW